MTLAIRRFQVQLRVEALKWTEFFIPHGERARILYDSKDVARVALGVAHARRNIALANKCTTLFCGPMANPTPLFITFSAMLATLGTKVPTVLPPWVSEALFLKITFPFLWPDRRFLVHRLLTVAHCLSRVTEVVIELQLE